MSQESTKDGAQPLLYVGWDEHMMFSAPVCLSLAINRVLFADFISQILPTVYGEHPDFARVDWRTVQWFAADRLFTPKQHQSLADNGLTHRSVLRFRTPGLEGLRGSCG
jgi:phenol hydroxylase P4 protein